MPLRTDIRVGGERTVKAHESGKEAVSVFKPVQFFGKKASLVEVSLETGRTHQIRVHAAHAGYPLAGDEKYGVAEDISYISTAGGAFLEFLEGKKLPAVEMLEQRAAC